MVPKIWASFAGVVLCTILLVNYRAGPVSLDDYKDSLSNSGSDATRLLAEEAGLKFDAEDNIVKSHLSRHKPIDEVLGDLSTPNFERKERIHEMKLDEKKYRDEAQLYRTKAHILRMASANDVAIAHHDLNEVEKLDGELRRISNVARAKRASFNEDTLRTLRLRRRADNLRAQASGVEEEEASLERKKEALRRDAELNKQSAEKDEDAQDTAQEGLTTTLVRRELSERALQQSKTRLARAEARMRQARAAAAALLQKSPATAVAAAAAAAAARPVKGAAKRAAKAAKSAVGAH